MKNLRNIYILQIIAGIFLLVSCSNEDYLGGHYTTDGAGVQANITATPPEGSTWQAGDIIGISTSYGSYDATARNREYVCEGGNQFIQRTGNPIYVKGNTSIVAYYPYSGDEGAEPSISLNTADQSNIKDYYFAKTDGINPSNGENVNLVFKNALSKLDLKITAPAGETIKKVRLSGFSHQAEVDPFTLDLKLFVPEDLIVADETIQDLSLQLIPQTVAPDAEVPAKLVLVGTIRSYAFDMSGMTLKGGTVEEQNINAIDGIGTIEFVPGETIWNKSGLPSSADTDNLPVTFEIGDMAGLFVVKDGRILKNNIALTYNVNGFWESEQPIEGESELEGAKYYAYYPYRETATFDVSSATPFGSMIAATTPSANQNYKADYEASNLMITTGITMGQYNSVSLSLKNQKAMVCIELPNVSYIFDNEGIAPYVMAKSENVKFTLNGTTIHPYFDDATQSYRFIVEPNKSGTIKVTCSSNGVDYSYETPDLAQLGAGQYAKFVVGSGAQLIHTTLQVGDYYCADGRLVSKNTPAASLPENVVGVVFKVGTTEAIRSANSNWCHAVVVGLKEKRSKWGTNSSATSEQNAAGWRYWYREYGLADQGTTSAASLIEDNMAEEGYETTQAWRKVPEPLTIGGFSLDYTSEMNTIVNGWNTDIPVPNVICSGWYIPSLRDLQIMESQSSLLSQQLIAVGGTDLLWNKGSSDRYWSCNVRGAGSNWCYVGGKTNLADRYKGVACNGNAYYRFLLAF